MAVAQVVTLNGNEYVVRESSFVRRPITPLNPPFRTTGRSRRTDRQHLDSYTVDDLLYGFGRAYIKEPDDPVQRRQFWDSRVETRFPGQLTLALLDQDSTEPSVSGISLNILRRTAEWQGELEGLWEGYTNSNGRGELRILNYTGASTAWQNSVSVHAAAVGAYSVGLDMILHKTNLVVLLATTNDHLTRRISSSRAVSSPAVEVGANLLTNNVRAGEEIDAGVLTELGNEIHAFLWDEAGGVITVFESTDGGNNWTDTTVDLGSQNGPTGRALFYDTNGDTAPVIGTAEGVYAWDVSANIFTLIYPILRASNNNCRGMTVWNGDLYVPLGDGGVTRIRHLGAGRFEITPVGPDLGDGLPSDTQGFCTAQLTPTDQWLFMAYGGDTSSRNARVLAYNGLGWHHMYRHGTANRRITHIAVSSRDDGTTRLHLMVRDTTAVAAVGVDAVSSGSVASATSLTISHTVAGTNRLLVVGVTTGVNDVLPSVTYAGVAMTQLATELTGTTRATLFYLIAPTLGANNIVVTVSLASAIIAGGVSFTGVDQNGPISAAVTNNAAGVTSSSVTVNGAVEDIVIDVIGVVGGPALTVGVSQTSRWNATQTVTGAGSTEVPAGATPSATMSWSWTGAQNVVHIAAAVKAAYPAAGDTRYLAEPLVNPYSGVTMRFQASGVLDLPEVAGGLPELSGNWLEWTLDGTNLSVDTTGQYVAASYATTGGSYGATALGNFLSGDLDLQFASGVGVSSRTLLPRLTLNRGATNTNSPRVRGTSLFFQKVFAVRYEYFFEVDLDATAERVAPRQSVDEILTALNTVETSVLQVTFSYGNSGDRNVKAVAGDDAWTVLLDNPERSMNQTGSRHGVTRVHLVELL